MKFSEFLNEDDISDKPVTISVSKYAIDADSLESSVYIYVTEEKDVFDPNYETEIFDHISKKKWNSILLDQLNFGAKKFNVTVKLNDSKYGDYKFPLPSVKLTGTKKNLLALHDSLKKLDSFHEMDEDYVEMVNAAK